MRITIQSDRPLTIGESRLFDCHHYDLADCRCSGALLLKEVGIRPEARFWCQWLTRTSIFRWR